MNKEEIIKRYGEGVYEWRLGSKRRWREANPEKAAEEMHSQCRKGGSGYEQKRKYMSIGIQGERNLIRRTHRKGWHRYKNIIAPNSQLHHQWRPGTSEYDGVALVEKEQHIRGIIDVIRILEGKINVFTEKELQGGPAI